MRRRLSLDASLTNLSIRRRLEAWLVNERDVKVVSAPESLVAVTILRPTWIAHAEQTGKVREYCLIVEGAYLSESDAEHALRDPFIEDWVEQTGSFRIHNMNEIQITPGVTLGSLGVVMLDDRVFEIASTDAEHPLTEHKAKGVAEALRRQDMFDEVKVEPRDSTPVE